MKPSITEAALDGVIERLLLAHTKCAAMLLHAASIHAAFDRLTVERQVRHVGAYGTADLVVRYWLGGACTAILLVENKIDAGFTPDQPVRYAISRDAQRSSAPAVATLLLAPARYLAGSKLASGFDAALPYESLLQIANGADGELITNAIERAESPYEPVPAPAMMDFFTGYTELARSAAPELVLKRNPNSAGARPEASRTIYFDAQRSGFAAYGFLLKDARPAALRVSHQCWDSGAPKPSVKAMLDGWARHLPLVWPILMPALLGSGIYLRPGGLSMALTLDTDRLDNMRPATEQVTAILDALSKVRRLRDGWNGLEAPLRQAAAMVSRKQAI